METTKTWLTRHRNVRIAIAVTAFAIGMLVVLATAALGHCSAFGGRCPRPEPSGDVFGGAVMGLELALAVPLWMRRPTGRGFVWALVVATPIAVFVGAVVTMATNG